MTADQLKAARKKLGLTQAELSEHLGWSSAVQISKLENGKADVMPQTALAIECLLRREGKR